jgi:hypothetical protein
MADARLVPSNLLAWPRVRSLLPDQKLILQTCWATAPSAAGCWLVDVASFAAHLSLAEAALVAALEDFKRRELIDADPDTGEIFLVDWYRFHTFKTAPRRDLLKNELRKIQSQELKERAEKAAAAHLVVADKTENK